MGGGGGGEGRGFVVGLGGGGIRMRESGDVGQAVLNGGLGEGSRTGGWVHNDNNKSIVPLTARQKYAILTFV